MVIDNSRVFPPRVSLAEAAKSTRATSYPDTTPHEAFDILGVPIHNVTRDQVLKLIEERIVEGKAGYILTPNVDHICRCRKDAALREAYRNCFLSVADGVWVIWASRLLGTPLREKISGSDLVEWVSEHFARRGYSLFLLGAAEGIADAAAVALRRRYGKLQIKGTYSPPMGFEKDPVALAETIRRVREAQADLCFVALGSPKQEILMHRFYEACGVPVMVGIGAGLDFAAGKVRRAPQWIIRIGMEWLWRMWREPRRLWRRYLIEDAPFFLLLWQQLRQRGGGSL
jgi:exopolysaccharide biosynthesis WecB/TagA/CpsF family protein